MWATGGARSRRWHGRAWPSTGSARSGERVQLDRLLMHLLFYKRIIILLVLARGYKLMLRGKEADVAPCPRGALSI